MKQVSDSMLSSWVSELVNPNWTAKLDCYNLTWATLSISHTQVASIREQYDKQGVFSAIVYWPGMRKAYDFRDALSAEEWCLDEIRRSVVELLNIVEEHK